MRDLKRLERTKVAQIPGILRDASIGCPGPRPHARCRLAAAAACVPLPPVGTAHRTQARGPPWAAGFLHADETATPSVACTRSKPAAKQQRRSCVAGDEAALGTLSERWQLLGLRGENSGSASRFRAWSPKAIERSPSRRGGRDRCLALLLRLWFLRDGVDSRKRDRRGGGIQTGAEGLRLGLQLDHVPRE